MKNPILNSFSHIRPARGEVAICRLGQHSFILKSGETLVAVDPYLTPESSRLIPPLIAAGDFAGMSLICCSHDHGDHLDRPSLRAMSEASPEARFLLPEAVRPSVSEIPADRIDGMNDGQSREYAGIRVTAIASAHEFLDRTASGLYPYLGYVIECGGVTVYHAGDCCVYEGLLTKLAKFRPDVMLLPINGRDAERLAANCIGNMTYQEAADLAGWLDVPLVIPAHYDMFAMNLEDPQKFLDYMQVKYPALEARVLAPGEILTAKGRRNAETV